MSKILIFLPDAVSHAIALRQPRLHIGRHRHNTIALPDPHVSGVHAVLQQTDGDWWIEDGRIYDRPVELFKFEYDPRLGAIPYWAENAQPDGSVYDERITQLTRTQLITLQRIDDDEAEMVCQRL